MANPTTNYGWPMPTSTDLVTDLPADFAAFGQPVDTTLKALNPETTLGDISYRSATSNTNTRLGIGTNGQVLAVSGGVPAWTTTSDVTPLTTKGDLFTFDTADARLAVGTNGQTLVADSSTATGLKWATVTSSSGLTLISRQSYSNVANTGTTFDNVFTTTYKVYEIIVENHYAATPNDAFQFIYRYGTTDGTLHNGNNLYATPGTSTTGAGTSNAAAFNVNIASGSSTYPLVAQMIVHNVGTGSGLRSQIYGQGFQNSDTRMFSFGGYTDAVQNMTGFKIKSASSNITGTISVYGLAV